MIQKLDDALLANDHILFVNEDSNNATFLRREMGILSIDLIKLILMILILKNMILKLVCISDLCLGVIDIDNTNRVKESKKMVVLVYTRR